MHLCSFHYKAPQLTAAEPALTLVLAAPFLAMTQLLHRWMQQQPVSIPSTLAARLSLGADFLDTANFPEEMD